MDYAGGGGLDNSKKKNQLDYRLRAIRGLVMIARSYRNFIIGLGTALLLAGCQISEDQLETWVKSKGFTVIDSPSRLYGPGSLVFRRNYNPNDTTAKLTLGYLCNPEYSTVLYEKTPRESPTLEQVSVTNFGGNISGGMPAISKIVDLNAKLKAASTIAAYISDVKIYAFGLDDLAAIKEPLGPRCRNLVNENVPKNAFQVSQVLQATVDVRVQIDASADVTARAHLIRQLANLGFTVSGDQTASLKGQALFFGVQLEPITTPIPAVPRVPVASGGPKHFGPTVVSAKSRAEKMILQSKVAVGTAIELSAKD
jgi:hypothetical protein